MLSCQVPDMESMVDNSVENAITQARIASDKAIRLASENAIRQQKAIREAENVVRPWVGQLELAFDSPEEVYQMALEALGVKDLDLVHPSTYRHILEREPTPGSRRYYQQERELTLESAMEFFKRDPAAARIGRA
jgi:uncharacterized protein